MMASTSNSCFTTAPGFCPDCGSVLPLLGEKGGVTCYTCKREWDSDGALQTNIFLIKDK